ncbi:hypothetical protein CCACVL1_04567, partial [Corchorus capsularis]
GRFEILSLSGSFMPSDSGGTRSRSGGMSVSLASPDGRVVGGGVAGLLVAASPVQVVVGSFLAGNQHEQKPKKQKHDSISAAAPMAAIPVSSADPKSNLSASSFRGDSWTSLPDSRNKPTDINFTVKAGLIFIAFQIIITILHESSSLPSDAYEQCLVEEKEESSYESVDIKVNGVSGDEMKEKVKQEKKCGINGGSNEEDEDFEDLERRIEEFIARSYRKWKEELVEENYNTNFLRIGNEGSYCEAWQIRKEKPRNISRPKNIHNIIKKQRLQLRRMIENMQIKAKTIKIRSYSIKHHKYPRSY